MFFNHSLITFCMCSRKVFKMDDHCNYFHDKVSVFHRYVATHWFFGMYVMKSTFTVVVVLPIHYSMRKWLACDNFGTLCQARTNTMCFSTLPLDVTKKFATCHSYLPFFADNQDMVQSSPPPSFDCYNMNCYRKFPTEQGLCEHLWHSDSCKKYVSLERPYASCQENVADESQRRPGYGVLCFWGTWQW
jgi:hypothetical protein